mgnify:CR=1 FL=1
MSLNNLAFKIQKLVCNHFKIGVSLRGCSQTTFKRGGDRWSKKSTFCKLLYYRKCKRREVGGRKKPNLVNVVCELQSANECYNFPKSLCLKAAFLKIYVSSPSPWAHLWFHLNMNLKNTLSRRP